MSYTINKPSFYASADAGYVDLGDVSGNVTVDFTANAAVEMNLIGDVTISFSEPTVRDTVKTRKLIIKNTQQFSYKLNSFSIVNADFIEGGGHPFDIANLVTGFSFTDRIQSGTVTCPWFADNKIMFLSESFQNEGVFEILYSNFPEEMTSYANLALDMEPQDSSIRAWHITDDGLYVTAVGESNDAAYLWELTTPYDFSTATFLGSTGDLGNGSEGVHLKNDGTSLFTFDGSSYREYSLGTPFDFTTVNTTPVQTVSEGVLAPNNGGGGTFQILNDGKYMVVSDFEDALSFYELTTAYDLSSAKLLENKNGIDIIQSNAPVFWTDQSFGTSLVDSICCAFAGDYFLALKSYCGLYIFNRANAHCLDFVLNNTVTTLDKITHIKV